MSARPPKPVIPPVVLTTDQEDIRARRATIDSRIETLREELEALKATRPKCKTHVFGVGKVHDSQWFWHNYVKEWFLCASTYCVICGRNGNWYCPKSPTGACEYDNGDSDSCDHCGMPDERK